jgi:HEAT repeat protein
MNRSGKSTRPTAAEIAGELRDAARSCVGAEPEASRALARLVAALEKISTRSLPAVDQHLRTSFSGYTTGVWEPNVLDRFAGRTGGWAFMAVATSHSSGFVREAAVRYLGRMGDDRAVPFLVLRLNDWVPQVRRASQSSLAWFLTPRFAAALVRALPLFLGLDRQRRGDHADVVASVLRLLRSAECQPAVSRGCDAEDGGLRRTCFRLLLESSEGAREAVLARALGSRDPQIRCWAVGRLGQEVQQPWALARARSALTDRSVQVRRLALRLVAGTLPAEEANPLLADALLDPSTGARWQARILRLERGPIDLAAFYRAALAGAGTAAHTRGALLGLGESGTRTDIAAVTAHLWQGPVGIRRAALRALSYLESDSTTQPFLAALDDALPGLSKEGRRALESRLAHVPASRLAASIGASEATPHARRNALSLASHLSKWESLPLLLEGEAAADRAVAERGRVLVGGWFARYNKSFVLPTRAQVDRLEEVWHRVGKAEPSDGERGSILALARRLAR